jgi:hypothetical protein
MKRILGTILLCGAVVMLLRGPAVAAPKIMTDDELDGVSASGGINLDFTTDPTRLGFSFDMGSMTGVGSVTTTPPSTSPNTLAFQGAVDLTNARFNVENMIFNLNICVQCQGNILQAGIGIPITVKTGP